VIDTTKIPWFKIAVGAGIGVFGLLVWKTAKTRPLGAFDMLKVIAAESRTPEEYARRAEAWASGESSPPPMTKLARFKKVSPKKMHALILAARNARIHGSRARHERFVAQPDEDEDDLDGVRLDREMARRSYKEERQAVSTYTKRLAKTESAKLKKALVHARKEEREHAAAFKRLR
jgi:rubrerythrin